MAPSCEGPLAATPPRPQKPGTLPLPELIGVSRPGVVGGVDVPFSRTALGGWKNMRVSSGEANVMLAALAPPIER